MSEQWQWAGRRVRQRRWDELKWSRGKLGLLANVDTSTIKKIEEGGGEHSQAAKKRQISDALGWTSDSIEDMGRSGHEPTMKAHNIGDLLAALSDHNRQFVEAFITWLLPQDDHRP